jgi:uncharacterized protein YjbI with pentapeptide repeats
MIEDEIPATQDLVARVREVIGASQGSEISGLLNEAVREYFRGTVVEDAAMAHTLFKNVDLSNSLFADATLRNALVFDTDLTNAIFANVNLTNASIKDANLEGFEIDGILIQPLLDAEIARKERDA